MSDSIGILGKPTNESYFSGLPWDYYIGTKEKDGEDFVDFNKAINKLRDAISLWCLVDDSRATELAEFIKNILYSELNDREIIFPGEEKDGYLISVEIVKDLYDLIGNIADIVAIEFTDNKMQNRFLRYYVLPEKETVVQKFKLGEWENDESGNKKLSIGDEIGNVTRVKDFLKIAIDNNRELVIG